ncbi:MAG: alcohol dehydrogenase catalytic domain-containing protein [Planctomycetes bacterium]|nr:alcohol dehydrogenase catalytic domain-containing protein [Planctomycetota bacterium]
MRAMLLTGISELEMQEVPAPVIKKDTEVLIKMQAVGVCGSDIHYYVSGRIGSQVVEYPFVVGHESSGVVASVGSAVRDFQVGDRIAIDPATPCFECSQCKAGRVHTCQDLGFLGTPGQAEGCLCEYIVMPESSCFKIKDSMTFAQAAISEPLSIGVYSVRKSIDIKGASVGILGAGPIGLSVLLAGRAMGAETIYITDKIDERVELARENGADWAGNPDTEDAAAKILEHQSGGLDIVFECCGEQEALDQAIDILKPGGKLMVVGIPQSDRISFDIDQMRRKEICVQNVRRQCGCVQAALDMIDNKEAEVDFMVTHEFSFEETKKAFDLVADYKDGVLKAMINF